MTVLTLSVDIEIVYKTLVAEAVENGSVAYEAPR